MALEADYDLVTAGHRMDASYYKWCRWTETSGVSLDQRIARRWFALSGLPFVNEIETIFVVLRDQRDSINIGITLCPILWRTVIMVWRSFNAPDRVQLGRYLGEA
jgi:hypothetical protein